MKISGSVTFSMIAEERAFWINAFKQIKAEGEIEKRILKRTLMKLMRKPTHNYPVYPPKECPICERTFHYKVFKRHHFICKQKRREPKFEVDPEILARI